MDVAVPARQLPLRDRYTASIARHEVAWELTFAALAIIYVVLGFAADDAPADLQPTLFAVDVTITTIFVVEFATRIYASRDRRGYLRGHWVDLVALVPFGAIRGLRIARLLRLLRLVRAFAGVNRALGHRGLGTLLIAWIGVMFITSAGVYFAERGVNDSIRSPLDAVWWGIETLTTVGYGDVAPVTPEGRLAASALMLMGIGLFGIITATVTSYMVTTDERAAAADPLTQLRELAALRDDGVITDAEFEAKKTVLLDRIT
jgi:voltage-gated potassium channel